MEGKLPKGQRRVVREGSGKGLDLTQQRLSARDTRIVERSGQFSYQCGERMAIFWRAIRMFNNPAADFEFKASGFLLTRDVHCFAQSSQGEGRVPSSRGGLCLCQR